MVRFLKEKYTNIFEERDFFEALIYIFMYGVRCFFDFNIMKIYSIEPNNLHTFNVDKHYFSFLKIKASDIKKYNYNKKIITDSDIKNAILNNDFLYVTVLTNTNKILSYTWFSCVKTQIDTGLYFEFPNNYFYMYKAYTEPEYRGYNLYPMNITNGFLHIQNRKIEKLIAYIDAENYRSTRVCKKIGSQSIGYIGIIKIFDFYHIFRSPHAKKNNCHVIQENFEFDRLEQEAMKYKS